ncbi:hypothetical protein [Alkalilacustris brevis]|uniref:hypothetical protein n=1 Tax=Alkalilacustris brevis TaxID=2026338 RepID=UPI000E0DF104|nr:hypothetical protein [Alkalilacustris brevis]
MLVFWEHRLAILATPKTGSTAIEAALEPLASMVVQRPPVLKHTPAYRFRRFIGPYLKAASGGDDFTVVAMMREPLDWLGSWYRYRRREEILDQPNSTAKLSFDQFVRDYMASPRPPHADVGAQARFLNGPDGLAVDRLFRYENIGVLIHFLEDRLGCEITLPKLNVSPSGSLEISPETEAALRRFAAEDFALYESLDNDRA